MEKGTTQVKTQHAERIAHANIYEALSAFQGELKPMPKSKTVEFPTKSGGRMKFSYTPLGEIMTAIYPLLGKHGLSVRHEMVVDKDGKDGIVAILTHGTTHRCAEVVEVREAGGETIKKFNSYFENEIRSGIVPVQRGGEIKEVGAAITYARRYSLTMVLGISSEDDTDIALISESAKNAVSSVYNSLKQALERAKDEKTIDKTLNTLNKDYKAIGEGRAPSLGLSKEQYEELAVYGQTLKEKIGEVDIKPEKE